MPKITYVLTLFGHGMHPSPVPVCGWLHPAPYGHAEYDVALNTHVLRVPQETWEGGMAADLAQKLRTHMDQWIVTVEVEPDPESQEGQLLIEVDALKAQVEMLEERLASHEKALAVAAPSPGPGPDADALRARRESLTGVCSYGCSQGRYNSSCPAHGENWRTEEDAMRAAALDAETPPVDPANPPTDFNLHPKTLDKLCRDAGIEVQEPKTKVKMRAALEAHYHRHDRP